MPYKSIAAAKEARFPTTADEIPLTLKQINKLAEIYDAVKRDAKVDNPMAVAWMRWKEIYAKRGDKWVLIPKVVSSNMFFDAETNNNDWVPVAKVGQKGFLSPSKRKVFYTENALLELAKNFKEGGINFNHDSSRFWNNERILNAKFENPFLYLQLSKAVREKLEDPTISGCSIQATPIEIIDSKVNKVDNLVLSLIEYPDLPACKVEEGCGVVSSLDSSNIDPSYNSVYDFITTHTPSFESSVSSITSQDHTLNSDIVVEREESKTFDIAVENNVGYVIKIKDFVIYGTKEELENDKYILDSMLKEVGFIGRTDLQFFPHDEMLNIGDVITNKTPIHTFAMVISKSENKENKKRTSHGGDEKRMENEKTITYTGEQVKDVIASADAINAHNVYTSEQVKDVIASAEAGNAHKHTNVYTSEQIKDMIASAEQEKETMLKMQFEEEKAKEKAEEANKIAELEQAHAKDMEEAVAKTLRLAKALGAFETKYRLSKEAIEGAKTLPVEALEYFNNLDLGAQTSPTGITSGEVVTSEMSQEEILKAINNRFDKMLGYKQKQKKEE